MCVVICMIECIKEVFVIGWCKFLVVGKGWFKGVVNKIMMMFKEVILLVVESVGEDGKGKGGL